ncbi:UbiA family prenyltransferase [Halobacteria archaeon AArc-dxtr1]|nr:UbiA family prenyltransferase [Halobacteria archaeon AArc-dxtr1]
MDIHRRSVPRGASVLKRALLALVHSNLFISAGATSVAITTMVLLSLPIDPIPLFVVFAVTLFVYSVNRLTDVEEDERNVPGRAAFTRRYGRFWFALGILGYLLAVGVAAVAARPWTPFLALPLLVAVAYSWLRLKRAFLVKNLTVGIAWGAIPLGVGAYYGVLTDPELLFFASYVTVMLTVAAAIFDIKDMVGDLARGIETVPNRYGPAATRRVSQAINLFAAAVVLGAVLAGFLSAPFLALLAFNAYVGAYIPFATSDRGALYYGFVVDGEHLFLAILVVLLNALVW